MNINLHERQALYTSKIIEGKTEQEASEDIIRDLNFIKEFNTQKREKERTIRQLDKEIGKRQDKLKKLKIEGQKRFIQRIKEEDKPKTYIEDNYGTHNNIANTNILKRVIHYLQTHQSVIDSDKIANFCCINKKQAKDAQLFINKYVRIENV